MKKNGRKNNIYKNKQKAIKINLKKPPNNTFIENVLVVN